jgi:hypothetical protein
MATLRAAPLGTDASGLASVTLHYRTRRRTHRAWRALRRRAPAVPSRPVPDRISDVGSGTAVTPAGAIVKVPPPIVDRSRPAPSAPLRTGFPARVPCGRAMSSYAFGIGPFRKLGGRPSMQAHALAGHAQVCEKVPGSSADDDDETACALDSLRSAPREASRAFRSRAPRARLPLPHREIRPAVDRRDHHAQRLAARRQRADA